MGKTRFQKLLMLYARMQASPAYHFVPYKYGCYSFQAMADVSTMKKYRQVDVDNLGIRKTDQADYLRLLKEGDRTAMQQLFELHGEKDYKALIKHTYSKYPYYATRSEIAERYLGTDELKKIAEQQTYGDGTILYTIGYEGISLEEYLNKLIRRDVKLLVDVRNNPKSMKYGFSKPQLLHACKSVGIEYMHIPEVGIVSEERTELKDQGDYDRLFSKYRTVNLAHTAHEQQRILSLLKERQRIALTCFEANICQCHRKHLAEAITQLDDWHYELIHIA